MGIHDGHRQRMKRRFLRHGLDNFDDVNALELLLCYALPRQDTNPLAHSLLDSFGSLTAVLEADAEQLCAVKGVGENAAALLRLIPAMSRRYMLAKTPDNLSIDSAAAAGRYFLPRFMYEKEEVLYALFLNSANVPLGCREISRGQIHEVEIPVRTLVETAISLRSGNLILAHNHPSGVAVPSWEDEQSTRSVQKALAIMDIRMVDHIVVAGSEYASMRECVMMD